MTTLQKLEYMMLKRLNCYKHPSDIHTYICMQIDVELFNIVVKIEHY